MAGISCRSSDRKNRKSTTKNRKKTEKYRKTGKNRKIPTKTEKTERYHKFQIWDWFFPVFFRFFGLQPPHILISGTRAVDQFANFIISFVRNSNFSFKIFVISNQKNLYKTAPCHERLSEIKTTSGLQLPSQVTW